MERVVAVSDAEESPDSGAAGVSVGMVPPGVVSSPLFYATGLEVTDILGVIAAGGACLIGDAAARMKLMLLR